MNLRALFEELMHVLQNPAEEPVRTALVAGLLFVAVVVVALLALIVMPSGRDEDDEEYDEEDDEGYDGHAADDAGARAAPDDSPAGRRRARLAAWGWGLVLTGALAGVLGGLLWADDYSRATPFCTSRCHVLDAAVASWQGGLHPEVDCVDCHRTPGVFGPVDTRVRAFRDLLANLRGMEQPVSAAVVDQQRCLRCHDAEMRGVLEKDGLRVRHGDFAAALSCAECHGDTGHAAAGFPVPGPESVMSLCARCHTGEGASSDCSVCHVGDVLFAGGAGMGKVDLPAPTDCRGCHDPAPCTACHGTEMPHPAEWEDPKVHAPRGAFGLDPLCSRCHEPGCPECHSRLRTNHGPEWRTGHQRIADGTGCVRVCHDRTKVGDDMCRLCH